MWRVDWVQFKKNLTIERKVYQEFDIARDILIEEYKEKINAKLFYYSMHRITPGANFKKFKEREKNKLKKKINKLRNKYIKIVNKKTKPTISF